MNWSRVKTILILFFLCTNLFLASVIVMSGNRVHTISDEIIHSTGEILKNNLKLQTAGGAYRRQRMRNGFPGFWEVRRKSLARVNTRGSAER